LTTRTPGSDGRKENKVMDSYVQRWRTGHDSLSAIKREEIWAPVSSEVTNQT